MKKLLALLSVVAAPVYLALPVLVPKAMALLLAAIAALVFGTSVAAEFGGALSLVVFGIIFAFDFGGAIIPFTGNTALDAVLTVA